MIEKTEQKVQQKCRNIVFVAVRVYETQAVKSLLLLWKLRSWF